MLATVMVSVSCARDSFTEASSPAGRAAPYSIVSSTSTYIDSDISAGYYVVPLAGKLYDEVVLGGVPAGAFIETAIRIAMNDMGYRYGLARDDRGLVVAYQVAMGDRLTGNPVESGLGIYPGLDAENPDYQSYEKGALILIVTDVASGRVVWRSALQGFASLDIPDAVRQERINEIIARMMQGFPVRIHP